MMKATLIGHKQPSETCPVDLSDVQELVAYCAKVSNPQGTEIGGYTELKEHLND